MATSFDRWEKDPFFSAAEEVQESADRMESVYRQWIQERKLSSNPADLCQELRTALGTAKWQLEELDRAVRLSDEVFLASESTRSRHNQFIAAIGDRISMVENSLKESNFNEGESNLTWVRLDEGERDELALFLSGPYQEQEKVSTLQPFDGPTSSCNSNELSSWKTREEVRENVNSPESDTCMISVPGEGSSRRLSDEQPDVLPPRMLNFSSLMTSESSSKMKWYRNGFRKWKGGFQNDTEGSIPLRNQQLSQGFNACYERSKICLDSCGDESYDKQLHGWLGAIQRQLQRSQYRIQYSRPVQMIVWAVLAVLLIVVIVLRSR